MLRLKVAILIFALAMAVGAQSQPDVTQILKKTSDVYKNLKTYQFEYQVLNEMKLGEQAIKMEFEIIKAVSEPGKMRMEVNHPVAGMVIVSNSDTTWTYMPMIRQYTKKATAPLKASSPDHGTASSPFAMLGDVYTTYDRLAETARRPRLLREEQIEVEGKKFDCYVIKYEMDSLKGEVEIEALPRTVWIDKTSYIVLKETGITKMKNLPQLDKPAEISLTMTMSALKINEPLPDTLFSFTPPDDAKEVGDFEEEERETASLAGQLAIDFTLKSIEGANVSLKDLKGKVVLLDFWASWCGPCRQEMPHLEKLYREFKDKGLVVLGINLEDASTAKKFLKQYGLTMPTVVDKDGKVAESYKVEAIPTVLVIDREGKIVAHHVGGLSEKELRAALKLAGLE